jgi:hypothetical protein
VSETFVESPLGGNLGATTLSVYRLDPTGTVPVEPLPDVVPGVFTPFRVTMDVVDSEQISNNAEVTRHPVQDFLDVVSHIHPRLRVMTVAGTLGALPKLAPFVDVAPPNPAGFARFDLLRIRNLERMVRARALVMVVSPRFSMARAVLANVTPAWSKEDGRRTAVSLTFVEVRLVSPLLGAEVVPDYPGQAPGNNVASGGGQSGTTQLGVRGEAPGTVGLSPRVPGLEILP